MTRTTSLIAGFALFGTLGLAVALPVTAEEFPGAATAKAPGWTVTLPSSEAVPLHVTEADTQKDLIVIDTNGVAHVNWTRLRQVCVTQRSWDSTAAMICILLAAHDGKIVDMEDDAK